MLNEVLARGFVSLISIGEFKTGTMEQLSCNFRPGDVQEKNPLWAPDPDLADDLAQKRSDLEEELRVRMDFQTMMGFILLDVKASAKE